MCASADGISRKLFQISPPPGTYTYGPPFSPPLYPEHFYFLLPPINEATSEAASVGAFKAKGHQMGESILIQVSMKFRGLLLEIDLVSHVKSNLFLRRSSPSFLSALAR